MRGWKALLFLVPLLLLAAPNAAAEDTVYEAIELELGTDYLWVVVTEGIVGIDASEVREDIDEDYGNGDGVVTSDEVARYRGDRVTFSEDTPECFEDWEFVRLDGDAPRRIDRIEKDVRNALGSVASESLVYEIVRIGFAFPGHGGSAEATVNLNAFGEFGSGIGCAFTGGWDMHGGYDWNNDYSGGYDSYATGDQAAPFAFLEAGMEDEQSSADPDDPEFRFELRGTTGHKLDRSSLRPSSLDAYWHDGGLVATSESQFSQIARQGTIRVDVQEGAILSGYAETAAWGTGLLFASGFLLAGVAWTTEYGRWMLFRWLFWVPGFTRLEKEEVLEHDRRSDIYTFIKENPGVSFSDIKERTELANGVLRHHLRILETQDFVKSIRDGFRVRFYMRGPRVDPEPYLSRTQKTILETIAANPGLTQKELAKLVGLPRHSVSYHTNKLADTGQLNVKPEGKWRRYFVSETVTV